MGNEYVRAPQQARSQETMRRFLEATAELLRERTFDEITVDQIVRRARSSKGAFYHRFEDKASLLRHLNGVMYERALKEWDDFLAPSRWSGAPLRVFLDAFVERLVRIYADSPNLMRAFVYEARWRRDEEVRRKAAELNGFVAERFRAVVRTKRSEVAHSDPERASAFVLAVLTSVLPQMLLFPDPGIDAESFTPAALKAELERMLTAYLCRSEFVSGVR